MARRDEDGVKGQGLEEWVTVAFSRGLPPG
jgi:hypothetical protein